MGNLLHRVKDNRQTAKDDPEFLKSRSAGELELAASEGTCVDIENVRLFYREQKIRILLLQRVRRGGAGVLSMPAFDSL
jgi:hypothetical protein